MLTEITDECTHCGNILQCELFRQGHGIHTERTINVLQMIASNGNTGRKEKERRQVVKCAKDKLTPKQKKFCEYLRNWERNTGKECRIVKDSNENHRLTISTLLMEQRQVKT